MPGVDTRLEMIPLERVPFTRVAAPPFLPLQSTTKITYEMLESYIQVVIKGNIDNSTDANIRLRNH